MKQVNFTEMKNGTREEYLMLRDREQEFLDGLCGRLLATLRQLDDSLSGYRLTRLEHSLQTATRAYRDDADEELVVAALLHDIGDLLAPMNHAELAALVLKPFVSEKTHWIIEKHAVFQKYYYVHHYGGDRNQRDRYRDHPYFQDTVDFCERWDQASFDPDYDTLPLEFFEPMMRRVFKAEKTY